MTATWLWFILGMAFACGFCAGAFAFAVLASRAQRRLLAQVSP